MNSLKFVYLYMKKSLLILFQIILLQNIFSQSNRPYAVWEDQSFSVYKFVRMDASTGIKTEISTIPGMTAFIAGNNTAIDFYNNRYHVAGMSGGTTKRLYTIDISSGTVIYNPVFTDNIIGIEFNCNDSLLYALKEAFGVYYLVTIAPDSATITTIASLNGMNAYVGGSFSLDVNQNLYSFVALVGSNYRLRSFSTQTGLMINDNIFPATIYGHRYNCEDGYVYGTWDNGGVYKLEKTDINTGIHTTVDTLNGVTPGFVAESQSVNGSGQYTFRGFDSNNDYAIFAVDLSGGSIINSSLTTDNAVGFEEASCCSMITSVSEIRHTSDMKIYPNPADDFIYLEYPKQIENIECFDIYGKNIPVDFNNNSINVRSLENGIYILKIVCGENADFLRIIVSH